MSIRLLRLGASLVVLLQLGCAAVAIPPARIHEFPPKKDTLKCDNGNCKAAVYARIAALDACEVMPEYKTMKVLAGWKPTMMWKIEKVDRAGDKYDYRFDFRSSVAPPIYGVYIVGNDPTQDFDGPGYGIVSSQEDKSIFKWNNKHGRSLPKDPFQYNLPVVSGSFEVSKPQGQC